VVLDAAAAVINEDAGFVRNAADLITSAHTTLSADGQIFGWIVTLAATGIFARAASAPLLYYSQVQNARAALTTQELRRIQAYLRNAPGSLVQKYRTFRSLRSVALRAAGTSPVRLMPWFALVNIPVFITASLAIRNIAANSPESWANAGIYGWFPDLAAVDPTGALPIANTALWLFNAHTRSAAAPKGLPENEDEVKAGGKNRAVPPKVPFILGGDTMTTAVQGLAIFSFPFMLEMPSGMFVFWISSGIVTAVQRAVLSSDTGRLAIGLPTAAQLAKVRREAGPPVLKATGGAVKAIRVQLEYVQREVLSSFSGRRVDKDLLVAVNKALRRERSRGRIGIDLEAVIRRDDSTDRKYIAVIRRGSAHAGDA
jgi:membrane protein insertase Oxa1/YidC/SpoIIIJ